MFYGALILALTFLFISVIYIWEYRKAERELGADKRYQRLIELAKEHTLKDIKKQKKKNNIWGES